MCRPASPLPIQHCLPIQRCLTPRLRQPRTASIEPAQISMRPHPDDTARGKRRFPSWAEGLPSPAPILTLLIVGIVVGFVSAVPATADPDPLPQPAPPPGAGPTGTHSHDRDGDDAANLADISRRRLAALHQSAQLPRVIDRPF